MRQHNCHAVREELDTAVDEDYRYWYPCIVREKMNEGCFSCFPSGVEFVSCGAIDVEGDSRTPASARHWSVRSVLNPRGVSYLEDIPCRSTDQGDRGEGELTQVFIVCSRHGIHVPIFFNIHLNVLTLNCSDARGICCCSGSGVSEAFASRPLACKLTR